MEIAARTIDMSEFDRIDIRVGRVIKAEPFPEARKPAYKLVISFPPRQVGPYLSEVLVLGAPDASGAVVLLRPDADIPLGGRVF